MVGAFRLTITQFIIIKVKRVDEKKKEIKEEQVTKPIDTSKKQVDI